MKYYLGAITNDHERWIFLGIRTECFGNSSGSAICTWRGVVEVGKDVVSPPWHTAFNSPLAVGKRSEFFGLCKAMLQTGIVPDFITIDGGEGGTGAAPVAFANSVGMPLKDALHFVNASLVGCGLRSQIRLIASGKSLSAFHLFRLKALGADAVNSARVMKFTLCPKKAAT